MATRQQIRSWINRQRTRPEPSKSYLHWLHTQYNLTCQADVIKNDQKPKRNDIGGDTPRVESTNGKETVDSLVKKQSAVADLQNS